MMLISHYSLFMFCYFRLQRRPPTDSRPYGLVIDGFSLSHVFKGYSGMDVFFILG